MFPVLGECIVSGLTRPQATLTVLGEIGILGIRPNSGITTADAATVLGPVVEQFIAGPLIKSLFSVRIYYLNRKNDFYLK